MAISSSSPEVIFGSPRKTTSASALSFWISSEILRSFAFKTTLAVASALYLDLAFLRRTFCAEFCPYGRLQATLVDYDTVIIGYDEEKLFTARPWPKNPDYPPGTLSYGDWTEFCDECHVSFFVF